MFEVTTEYDKKTILMMNRAAHKTFRRKQFLIRRIFLMGLGLVCLVSGGLLLLIFSQLDSKDKALAVGATLIGVLAVGEGVFLDRLGAWGSARQMLEGSRRWRLRFSEEGFSGENEDGVHADYPYSQIRAAYEMTEYFLLQIDKLHCVILDKNGFTQGTSEEFRRFIADKTGAELRTIKI